MQKKTRQSWIKTISFLSALCVLFAALSLVNAYRVRQYRAQLLHTANQSLSQLCTQVDAIETALRKGSYAASAPMLASLSATLTNTAAGAKLTLSQLTDEDTDGASIYHFLSQVGDYTNTLSRRLQSGKPLSEAQKQSLRDLCAYAETLCSALRNIRQGLDDDTVHFETLLATLPQQEEAAKNSFQDAFGSATESLTDYPTLLYDGPFADARLHREAKTLEGLDEISLQTAKSRAAKYLACEEKDLVRESDEESALDLFCFSKGARTVGLTKRGGLLCYLTSGSFAGKSEISPEAAVKIARSYLRDIGYKNMKETYYSTYDGVCTVNFAYTEKGTVYYGDLIKVSVALDKAAVVAADARGYLMNHTARTLPQQKVKLKTAVRNLSDGLDLLDYKTALIPLDDGTEALCHELHCRDAQGNEVLVYADTQREREADIKLLLRADDGVLAK